MAVKKKNILLTGHPGVGKTTLLKKLGESLKPHGPVGFFTEEIREGGGRVGFALVALDGKRGVLSHVDLKSLFRVSRYKVDIKGFEAFLDSIPFMAPAAGIIIIDEIGKMESLSEKFQRLIRGVLDSPRPVIATIASVGTGFITDVKKRGDVMIFEVTEVNRDLLSAKILEYLNSFLFPPAA